MNRKRKTYFRQIYDSNFWQTEPPPLIFLCI
ncbi:rCG59055 [Rattus norvegicus]|uniref:RCG59055 n=1 Tax=Rattus norvegicus TaxID=10116 RepID=A6JPW4_RAT|nr:rCG59055 [Rattus norvegicus]